MALTKFCIRICDMATSFFCLIIPAGTGPQKCFFAVHGLGLPIFLSPSGLLDKVSSL
jgi:hypothetical protein